MSVALRFKEFSYLKQESILDLNMKKINDKSDKRTTTINLEVAFAFAVFGCSLQRDFDF